MEEHLMGSGADLAQTKMNLAESSALSGKVFEHEERYRELVARKSELVEKLDITKNQAASQLGAYISTEDDTRIAVGNTKQAEKEAPEQDENPTEWPQAASLSSPGTTAAGLKWDATLTAEDSAQHNPERTKIAV